MALGVSLACQSAGLKVNEDVYIVGVDGMYETFEAIKDGTISATITCTPKFAEQVFNGIEAGISGEADFPAPFSPISAWISPFSTENSILSRAFTPANSFIYQELNMIPYLTVSENIFLGHYPCNKTGIDWKKMHEDAQVLIDELGVDIDVKRSLNNYSTAKQQIISIIRAVNFTSFFPSIVFNNSYSESSSVFQVPI